MSKKGKGQHHPAVTTAPATTPPGGGGSASASTAHDMLIAVGIMAGFVMFMTLVAGTSKTAGKLSALLMLALFVNQGIRHVNPFVEWAASHPLTPGGSTGFTVGGTK